MIDMDLQVEDHGTIFLLRPLSKVGQEWVDANVQQDDETQYWGNAIVVEHRYIGDIVAGAKGDGLEVTT